jgi:hypothetical protein
VTIPPENAAKVVPAGRAMMTALSAVCSKAPVVEVVKFTVQVVWAPTAVDPGVTVSPDTVFAAVIDTATVAALVSAEVATDTDGEPVVAVSVTPWRTTDNASPAVTETP